MVDFVKLLTGVLKQMKEPYGIGINSLNHIYVNDSGNDRVLVFDEQGSLISKWDQKGSDEGAFDSMGFGG